MKSKRLIAFSIAIVLSCAMATESCIHKDNAVPTVSFSADVMPIIRASCAINSGCHIGSGNDNDHIDLTDSLAYNTIITKNLVTTKDPTASLMYVEIETGTMPKVPYSSLPQSQATLILNWIKQGAANN